MRREWFIAAVTLIASMPICAHTVSAQHLDSTADSVVFDGRQDESFDGTDFQAGVERGSSFGAALHDMSDRGTEYSDAVGDVDPNDPDSVERAFRAGEQFFRSVGGAAVEGQKTSLQYMTRGAAVGRSAAARVALDAMESSAANVMDQAASSASAATSTCRSQRAGSAGGAHSELGSGSTSIGESAAASQS